MNRKALCFMGAVAALTAVWAAPAQAKDFFYYIGYDVIQVVDENTDEIVADIPVKGWLREVGVTADHKTMFVTANRHIIHKVDLKERRVVHSIDLNGIGWERLIFGFAPAPDGKTAYAHLLFRTVTNGEPVVKNPIVGQIDLESGKVLRTVDVPWGVGNLISTDDGKTLFAVGQDLIRIDTTGKELKIVETKPLLDDGKNSLPFWPKTYDNGGIAVAPYYTATGMGVVLIDVKTGQVVDKPLKDMSMVYTLVLSPDHKKAYGGMDDIVAYDLEQGGAITATNHIGEGTNFSITISSDGKKVYTAAGGYTMTVFDAATLQPLKVVKMATDGMDMIRLPN
jgi:DNA-binding beta-propeller fold protein YncE